MYYDLKIGRDVQIQFAPNVCNTVQKFHDWLLNKLNMRLPDPYRPRYEILLTQSTMILTRECLDQCLQAISDITVNIARRVVIVIKSVSIHVQPIN